MICKLSFTLWPKYGAIRALPEVFMLQDTSVAAAVMPEEDSGEKYLQWLAHLEDRENKLATNQYDFSTIPMHQYRSVKLKEYIPGRVSMLNVTGYTGAPLQQIMDRESAFHRKYFPARNVSFRMAEAEDGSMQLAALGVDVREANYALELLRERKRLKQQMIEAGLQELLERQRAEVIEMPQSAKAQAQAAAQQAVKPAKPDKPNSPKKTVLKKKRGLW
jgi:hypothetical protein